MAESVHAVPIVTNCWAIKHGSFPYNELLVRAETLINEVENLFAQSDLPEAVNSSLAINTLVEIRTKIYG